MDEAFKDLLLVWSHLRIECNSDYKATFLMLLPLGALVVVVKRGAWWVGGGGGVCCNLNVTILGPWMGVSPRRMSVIRNGNVVKALSLKMALSLKNLNFET